MALIKIKSDRLKKLEAIKSAGLNPYPAKTMLSADNAAGRLPISEALENFEKLAGERKEVLLFGRLRSIRLHGALMFVDLEDTFGRIQLYLKKDEVGDNEYNFFADNFDVGDFVEVAGQLLKTQRGEPSLLVKKYRLLAKSLNQLPEKWHGLKDVEERFRKRYLDLLMNKEVKERFLMRSKIIKGLRVFFENEGAIEVETPILQPLPGGALARPFKTHLNALDMDLYLRVAPELYLKRLLVGGFEKVFEIGRLFRNEGMDKFHNPDFTELEFYWAYADYEKLIELVERLFVFLIPEQELEFQGQKINFMPPFKRITFRDLIMEHFKIDIEKTDRETLERLLKKNGKQPDKNMPGYKIIDEFFKAIRPKIIQPAFVLNHPLAMSPLAKSREENPKEAARFQLVVGGLEIINAYSELNDPQEQARRMKEQEKLRHDEEIQRFDQDYIDALEYGMPPAAGLGLGVDRLVQILTDSPNIREVILFPTMRPKE